MLTFFAINLTLAALPRPGHSRAHSSISANQRKRSAHWRLSGPKRRAQRLLEIETVTHTIFDHVFCSAEYNEEERAREIVCLSGRAATSGVPWLAHSSPLPLQSGISTGEELIYFSLEGHYHHHQPSATSAQLVWDHAGFMWIIATTRAWAKKLWGVASMCCQNCQHFPTASFLSWNTTT